MICHLTVHGDEVQIFANSTGAAYLGFRCIFRSQWVQGCWSNTDLFSDSFMPNIALLELLVIVTAFEIWAPEILASVVTLRLDNEATVVWIQSLKSDTPAAKKILCKLILTCLFFQIHTQSSPHKRGSSMRKATWWFIFACRSSFTSLQRCVQTGSHAAKETRSKKSKHRGVSESWSHWACKKAKYWISVMAAPRKTLEDFKIACEDTRLPLEWNHHQIHQLLIRINEHYFSASDIKILWKLMHDISKMLKFCHHPWGGHLVWLCPGMMQTYQGWQAPSHVLVAEGTLLCSPEGPAFQLESPSSQTTVPT